MDRLERLADILAIQALNADFAFHLDHGGVEELVRLFSPGATYTNGARRSQGRDQIGAFLRARSAAGVRTSRHLYSGLRISFHDDARASGTSVCMSFARNQAPPIDHATPFLVADFEDGYERIDGEWLIASRNIRPIFRDPDGAAPAVGPGASRPDPCRA